MQKPVEGNHTVIIGSGVGGLSAGILLSLLGFRVTVVEKNNEPGGLMRSYLRRGIDCPVGVHYVGALGAS
ncbi:MAG TPA: NAD(P)-binding protein, partial [Smithellaceae bacterium]|nr:NAD(P)-binding protein [Smithellaceae bacterium]